MFIDYIGFIFNKIKKSSFKTANDYFKKHHITRIVAQTDYENNGDYGEPMYIIKFNHGHYAMLDEGDSMLLVPARKEINNSLRNAFSVSMPAYVPDGLSKQEIQDDNINHFNSLKAIKNVETLDTTYKQKFEIIHQ